MLIERGYSEQEVRKQILRARSFSIDSLLDRENTREVQNRITFNLTYYPVAKNFKKVLAELHLFLTPDVAHKVVFTNMPIIDFKNDRSLKDNLVLAVLPKHDVEDRSKSCGGSGERNVKRRGINETFNILKGPLDCNSNHAIDLF